MFLIALGLLVATAPQLPEENYDFLSVTDGPCVPKQGVRLSVAQEAECARMSEPRHYHGTWYYLDFETSYFSPAGKPDCVATRRPCAVLMGESLPWPGRWGCARKFEVDFIGRRNVLPGGFPRYTIVVDKLISAKRLPDPYDENCDPRLHPELKPRQ